MKHNSLISANGLLHNPLASTTIKSSFLTAIFKPLLLLFLLVMGSSVVWADTYFKPGETIYLRVSGNCKNWYNFGGWAVIFYYAGNDNIAYGQNAYHERLWNGTGDLSSYLIRQETYSPSVSSGKSAYRITDIGAESNNERILSFTVPTDGTTCIDRFRICRLEQNVNDGNVNGAQHVVSASGAGTDKNRVFFSAWQDGDGTWETGTGATITTTTCSGGGGSSLSGDFYVYGAGPNDAMNWVTGWSSVEQGGGKSNPLNHMTISGNVARKTYCGVKGNNLEFKIAQNNADEATWTKYNSSKTTATGSTGGFFTAATNNNGNIRFSLSKPSDVTVCYDGTDVWLEIYERVQSSTQRRACGTFNGWSGTAAELTRDDAHGCYSVTLQNVEPRGTVYNGHQYMHFKIFKGVSNGWEGEMNANGDCDIHAMGATVLGDASVDDEANPNSEHRIIVQVDVTSNITIEYYLKGASNGRKQIAINCVPVAAPGPDPEPATTYTVTLHPNNGGASTIVKENVPKGSTSSAAALGLSSIAYGNGTATWYTNEACTEPFTSVTEDNMNLYAKWGVSGNFYLVGDFGMHDKGSNWAYNSGLAMTTTDGVASVTYIAPKGRHRFEILTSRSSWPAIANQGSGLIAASTPTLSWSNEGAGGYYHFKFDLDAPKKVTVRYDGKVSVTAEDYVVAKTGWTVASKSLFGHGSEESPDNADDGAYMNGYNMTEGQMNSDGELVIHNLNAGTYKFWIGKYNTALNKQKQNVEVFGAAHVDKANSSLGDYGSLANVSDDTYNRSIPMDDKLHRRVTFTLTQKADIKIAFDGGKIKVNVLPTHTVTFKNGETTFTTAQVFDGNVATAPASNPEKAGHEFTGWDWNFTTPITGDQIINAQFSYKDIESVSLNESTHMTWVGNTDFTLTPTYDPSDLITKTVAWSSDNTSVATVSNGTVHAVSAGTATITCTVTDQFDTQKTATCEVSVAACEMATDNIYSMTVTGYNSSTGSSATLNGLWNESSDNTEPASMTITRLAFHKKDAGNTLYAYDDNGTVKVKEDASGNDVQWILIPVGENYTPSWNGGNACQLYYIKNVSTGKFMHRGSAGVGEGNPDWWYSVTNTNATNAATDDYKWFFVNENDNQRCVYVKSGVGDSKAHSYKLHTSNEYNNCTDTYAAKPLLPVGRTGDINDYAKSYKNTNDFNYDTYTNPNYKASQMNSSYYRMKENATVQANLANGLAYGSVITVRLYADAATSVKLQTAAGDDVETINLSADAALEYTYTVAYGSELVGATAFIIKAADNHAGIASIVVARTYAAHPSSPDLAWEADLTGGVIRSVTGGSFRYVASSAEGSLGAVTYTSSDGTVATVASDGTVTPLTDGTTTITAMIEANGCYSEQSITYSLTLSAATLAELIIATEAGGTLTLTGNYAEDAVIDKAITINGQGHTIGNLTVEQTGDLTLSSGLTVNDFTICAKAGNTSIQAASGQVRNANNLTVSGNAYFLYTVDPSGHVQYGWYDFTVPFPVNVMSGIAGIQDNDLNEDFVNERNYAIMEYLGERKAQGQYPYQKFRGVMQPNQLYSITLDNRDNYNTVRFRKTTADGALVAGDNVTLHEYAGSGVYTNLNGVGNGTLHHANAGISGDYVQVYQSGDKTFLTVAKTQYSFVVGTAFMVQETGTMTLSQATHGALLAPSRYESAPATAIQIAREGQPFSDQLFISASETGGQAYTPGTDLAKAGDLGSANVPQIWTTAYNNPLCVHEAQLINGEASYNLSLYAPAAGSYTLTSLNIPADYSLYLTQNGTMLGELNGTYTLDLNKGITTKYGLLLVETYKTPTGIEEIGSRQSEIRKIMHNGVLYILHNGKVYNAQGAKVK